MKMLDNLTKRYYTIGEVSKITALSSSLLRFWETEFKELNPKKGSGGKRQYTKDDIDVICVIHSLLKVKGYTIEGAKASLKSTLKQEEKIRKIDQKLRKIKAELLRIKSSF